MDSNSGKNPFDKGTTPAKTTAAPPKPEPPAKAAATHLLDQVGLGLLSLVVGCIALSLNAIPFLRILAVLMSLAGLGLAIWELRSPSTPSKVKRNQGRAIAGAIVSSFVLALTVVRPFLPGRIGPIAHVPMAAAPRPTANSTSPAATAVPSAAAPAPETSAAAPQATPSTHEAPANTTQVPAGVPQVIPFPGGKHLQLVPSVIEVAESADTGSTASHPDHPKELQWVDASSSAAQYGEVTVSVASAAIERLKLKQAGQEILSPSDNLVIRVQVLLIGTAQKVNFDPWSNSNFGDARNKPSLTDNSSNTYQLRIFEAGAQIVDHERPKSLYPKLYADDFVVLEIPQANVEFLRLELPAAAFGGTGSLRFQIPKSMIETKKDEQH